MLIERFPLLAEEAGGTGEGVGGGADPGASRAADLTQAGQAGNILDWRQSLPENIRTAPIVQQHHTTEAAAKTLVNQAQMLGRGIFLPQAEPGTDEYATGMQKVYDKLGRPESAEKYVLPIPEGKQLDSEVSGRWKKAFYAAGLSQSQVDEVMGEYWRTVQYAENVRQGQGARSMEEGRRALYAEFGASTDEMVAKAEDFFSFFGRGAFGGQAGQDAWKAIGEAVLPDGSYLRNHPGMIAAFAEARGRLSEGDFRDSDTMMAPGTTLATLTTRAQALTEKRNVGTITAEETAELSRAIQTLARQRDREQTRNGFAMSR